MTGVSATGTPTSQLDQLQAVPEISRKRCHRSSFRTDAGPTGPTHAEAAVTGRHSAETDDWWLAQVIRFGLSGP
eukprot:4439057-Prymnesium_polylepis.1